MKQTKLFLGFLLLIITLITGCSKEDVINNDTTTPPNTENKITLSASTSSDTEEETENNNLVWEEADKFALYDATGTLAATFTLTDGKDSANGTFETEDSLTDGAGYTACYPAIEDATTLAAWENTMRTRQSVGQTVDMSNSDPMAHLSDIFGMSQNYTYNASNPASIIFSHRYATLILEIAKPVGYIDTDVPTELRFVNDSIATVVTLTNFPATWNDNDTLKIYTLMLPSTGTDYTLSFSLNGESTSYTVDISSSMAYEAGKHYIAELKDDYALLGQGLYYQIGNSRKTLWNDNTFKSELTDDNSTVFISTAGNIKMNNANYKDLLDAINSTSRTGLTLDLSGALAEADAMVREYEWENLYEGIKAIAGLPVGITSLEYTFMDFTNLTSIAEIPNSVTSMSGTFNNCKTFNQQIVIPNSVTEMSATFEKCINFNQQITIPNSVTNMDEAFYNCNTFNQQIIIPDSVTSMSYTFYNCTNFNQQITIPDSVTNMEGTFEKCTNFNQQITIPNSVTNMDNTFRYCTNFNQQITIPNSVTTMEITFENCTKLASTITIHGASDLSSSNAFDGTTTENISLILGPNRTEWTGGNIWEDYTFKSITSAQ